MRINIIGNNANDNNVTDGGRIKIRLFRDLLEKENYDVHVIELDGWKRNPLKLLIEIKKAIKLSERIVIMAGPRGCRLIIPIVNFFNRKKKSHVVFCPLGIGTLDALIKKMSKEEAQKFLSGEIEIKNKDLEMGKNLSLLDYVVVENKALLKRYKSFYNIDNVFVLENFRDLVVEKRDYNHEIPMKVVYYSRVKNYKGIFDLINAVKAINKKSNEREILLDIYGDIQLSEEENKIFFSLLDDEIKYNGVTSQDESIALLKRYDLFCLPTKYYGEGTSGALVEAMIAGTPVLVSSYSQVKELVSNGDSGLIFDFDSIESLQKNLENAIALHKEGLLERIGISGQIFAEKYTYKYNKCAFLKYFAGKAD